MAMRQKNLRNLRTLETQVTYAMEKEEIEFSIIYTGTCSP